MNKVQIIASEISGYEHNETSACDDAYYDLETVKDKFSYIRNLAENCFDAYLSYAELTLVYNFLESEFDNTNDTYHAFESLNPLEIEEIITYNA